jgi:hypothetical protein
MVAARYRPREASSGVCSLFKRGVVPQTATAGFRSRNPRVLEEFAVDIGPVFGGRKTVAADGEAVGRSPRTAEGG